MTVIFRRRGGCDLVQSFSDWKGTITSAPDVIGMKFLPIVSLVDDIPGKKHLARAVDLYLTCKTRHVSGSLFCSCSVHVYIFSALR
jgi:hypothetical protein